MWFDALTLRLGRPLGGAATPFNSHATLNTNLVSYWKLDETSLVRYDSVTASANDLTDNNTVGSAAGMRNDAASFVAASSEYLSIASNSTLNFSEDTGFTFAFWLRTAGGQYYASKDDEGANRQWLWNGGTFYYFNDAGSFISVAAGFDGGDINVWRLCIVWYDPADDKLHYSKDDGATADSAGTIITLKETTTVMNIGESAGSYFNGRQDESGIWSRALTAPERTDLWNSGNGLFYGS